MSSPKHRLPLGYWRPGSSANGNFRGLWFLSIAFAFLLASVISAVSATTRDDVRSLSKTIHQPQRLQGLTEEQQRVFGVSFHYFFDKILKRLNNPETQSNESLQALYRYIGHFANLYAKAEQFPEDYDTVLSAYLSHMWQHEIIPELEIGEEHCFSISPSHHDVVANCAKKEQDLQKKLRAVLPSLIEKGDVNEMLVPDKPEHAAKFFARNLAYNFRKTPMKMAKNVIGQFRAHCSPTADLPKLFFEGPNPDQIEFLKSTDKWYKTIYAVLDCGVTIPHTKENRLAGVLESALLLAKIELDKDNNDASKVDDGNRVMNILLNLGLYFDFLVPHLESFKSPPIKKFVDAWNAHFPVQKTFRDLVKVFDSNDKDVNYHMFEMVKAARLLWASPEFARPPNVPLWKFDQAVKCAKKWEEINVCIDADEKKAANYLKIRRQLFYAGINFKDWAAKPGSASFDKSTWKKLVNSEQANGVDQNAVKKISMQEPPCQAEAEDLVKSIIPVIQQLVMSHTSTAPPKTTNSESSSSPSKITAIPFRASVISAGVIALCTAMVSGGILACLYRSDKKTSCENGKQEKREAH
eukprot:GHVT01014361.1.p1 GENE.GHVT01014361.1~~GHVT01014361.1.p1  ORF type:complete len:589 (-),score=44.20 GHVT01014361.1:719-2461(-)